MYSFIVANQTEEHGVCVKCLLFERKFYVFLKENGIENFKS